MMPDIKRAVQSACLPLPHGFLLGLLFDPECGKMFLRNMAILYITTVPRRNVQLHQQTLCTRTTNSARCSINAMCRHIISNSRDRQVHDTNSILEQPIAWEGLVTHLKYIDIIPPPQILTTAILPFCNWLQPPWETQALTLTTSSNVQYYTLPYSIAEQQCTMLLYKVLKASFSLVLVAALLPFAAITASLLPP
jgi:hypothetical protein